MSKKVCPIYGKAMGHIWRSYDAPGGARRCKCGEPETVGTQETLDLSQGEFRPRARREDPETSHDAAASVGDISSGMEAILTVLGSLGEGPDEVIYAEYELRTDEWDLPRRTPSGFRTLRKELQRRGYVTDSGKRRLLKSGRKAIVWRPTTELGEVRRDA